jgi:hypothetical protein
LTFTAIRRIAAGEIVTATRSRPPSRPDLRVGMCDDGGEHDAADHDGPGRVPVCPEHGWPPCILPRKVDPSIQNSDWRKGWSARLTLARGIAQRLASEGRAGSKLTEPKRCYRQRRPRFRRGLSQREKDQRAHGDAKGESCDDDERAGHNLLVIEMSTP